MDQARLLKSELAIWSAATRRRLGRANSFARKNGNISAGDALQIDFSAFSFRRISVVDPIFRLGFAERPIGVEGRVGLEQTYDDAKQLMSDGAGDGAWAFAFGAEFICEGAKQRVKFFGD